MKYRKPSLLSTAVIVVLIIMIVQSCVDHTLPEIEIDTCAGTPSYLTEVKPIIDTSCAITGCHNGDNGSEQELDGFYHSAIKKFQRKGSDNPASRSTRAYAARWINNGRSNSGDCLLGRSRRTE